jgi:hypothetical protein
VSYYSIADKCALLERINSSIDLTTLLDLLVEQIEKLGILNGYLINLADAERGILISKKVHFPNEYQFLEETYANYRVSLKTDTANISVQAFLEQQTVQADIAHAGEEVKKLLGLWKLEGIAAIPLDQPGRSIASQACRHHCAFEAARCDRCSGAGDLQRINFPVLSTALQRAGIRVFERLSGTF